MPVSRNNDKEKGQTKKSDDLTSVSGGLAALFIKERIRKGGRLHIPKLDIVLNENQSNGRKNEQQSD